jgi:hypothetical protein
MNVEQDLQLLLCIAVLPLVAECKEKPGQHHTRLVCIALDAHVVSTTTMMYTFPRLTWRAVRSWSSAFTSQLKSRDSVPSCSAAVMRLVSLALQDSTTGAAM